MFNAGTEWTGSKQRMLAGIITDYFFGFGYILLAGVAYLIRDWRKLQLAISAPGFLFIVYIWWVGSGMTQIWCKFPKNTLTIL